MNTKIITDSISDISKNVAEEYDIEVLPISVSIGGAYISAHDVDIKEVIKWIRENKRIPEFKGISTETYAQVFERYINQGMEIVCIVANSRRISSYDCACHASTRFPDANIQVIDSKLLSGSLGLMAMRAASMAKENTSANAIAINLERNLGKFELFDLADTLEFFEYMGDMSKITTARNAIMNTKFMLMKIETMGGLDTVMHGHSMDKAIEKFCKIIFKDLTSIDSRRIFLTHTISDKDYFSELYKYVNSLNYFKEIIVCETGCFSTSYVGPNCIKAAYQFK